MTENIINHQNQENNKKSVPNTNLQDRQNNINISIDNKAHSSKSKPKSRKMFFTSKIDTDLETKTQLLEKAAKKVKKAIKLGKSSSGSIVTKNRIFTLIPKPFVTLSNEEKQIITKFPTEYAKFLKTGKNLCHNDINFCYELLKPTKNSFYKFFNDNGLFFPKITEETTEYPSLCYRFLQNHSHKYLLESFYNDGRFREIYVKAAEYFQRISDNPFLFGKFKGTSNIHIMKTFISGNKTLLDLLSQKDESSHDNWHITYNTKVVIINSIFFAFRHKIIKNFWFFLLSKYVKNNILVSEKEFTRFLLNNEISNGLARKLYKELLYDVGRVFRGWKGAKPTWQQFLNELRFFRKKLCNELPDLEIQKFIEKTQNPVIYQDIIGEILDQEKTKSIFENSDNDFSNYLVDQFIIYCKKKSKYQFKRMFNKYYLGETKNNKKINDKKYKNYNLFQEFLTEITSNYLKQKNLSVDQNSKAKKLWRKMIDNKTGKHYIHEVLDNSKTLWLDLMEKVDLKQLTSERIKIWLKRFNEEFNLEKNRNYSTTGDLFNDIEKITTDKLKMRVVIQKKIEFNSKNPSNVKNNLKFFQNRRVISSMIPTSSNQSISNLEKELFDKILSATPYKDKTENYYQKDDILQEDRILNSIPIQQIIPCFESYIRSELDKKIEEIMRKRFTGSKSILLKQKLKIIKYPMPVFKNLNFSTGPANKQLFKMDIENHIFKLCLFKKSPKRGIWYDFIIQDEDTSEELRITRKKKNKKKRFYDLELDEYNLDDSTNKTKKIKKTKNNISRLSNFSNIIDDNGVTWKTMNPTVVYDFKRHDFRLHIPFEKIIPDIKSFKKNLKQDTVIPQNKAIDEIVIGIDQGISWYAAVSVELIKSKYRKTKEGKIIREIIARKSLRHYYLNDLEVFGISFNKTTGLFNNGSFDNSGKFIKRKTNNLWGKGKFRVLKRKIKRRQKYLMSMSKYTEKVNRQNYSHPYPNDPILSNYWNKFHGLQKTLASNLAAKIRDIAVYYQTVFKNDNPSFHNCPVRVQVEYLKWVVQKPKYKTGYFLSHNNIHFIFSQFQESLKNLLIEHGIGLWQVSPRYTSRICSFYHYHDKGTRSGKKFYCNNPNHKLKNNRSYSCNADLNAARNISQFPPIALKACNAS